MSAVRSAVSEEFAPFELYIIAVRRTIDGDDYIAESGDPQVAAIGDTPQDALASFLDCWRATIEVASDHHYHRWHPNFAPGATDDDWICRDCSATGNATHKPGCGDIHDPSMPCRAIWDD